MIGKYLRNRINYQSFEDILHKVFEYKGIQSIKVLFI